MIIADIQKLLTELREKENLEKFQIDEGKKFCKKHNITSGQLNFLLSVVGAERIKKNNIL